MCTGFSWETILNLADLKMFVEFHSLSRLCSCLKMFVEFHSLSRLCSCLINDDLRVLEITSVFTYWCILNHMNGR